MTDIQIFNSPEFGTVRTLEDNGVVLFFASDVARALGYAKPQNAVAVHCKGALKRGICDCVICICGHIESWNERRH